MIIALSFIVKSNDYNRPKFRIWLNDKMLLEQTYICSNEYEVLYETCEIELECASYELKLEPLTNSEFEISRIRVNDLPVESNFVVG